MFYRITINTFIKTLEILASKIYDFQDKAVAHEQQADSHAAGAAAMNKSLRDEIRAINRRGYLALAWVVISMLIIPSIIAFKLKNMP